jgi:hypothetical protein
MLTCKNGCPRPVCHESDLCLRCAGAAEERARIVAMLHREADEHERAMVDPRKSDVRTSLLASAISLRDMADRIERGEP